MIYLFFLGLFFEGGNAINQRYQDYIYFFSVILLVPLDIFAEEI